MAILSAYNQNKQKMIKKNISRERSKIEMVQWTSL